MRPPVTAVRHPTVRPAVARLPTSPGVYRFRDARGAVLYIGRATDLRHRVASYWSDLGDRRHLERMVSRIERIEAVACDSLHEAAWLERNLLERARPRWNRMVGVEVPVYIRLDEGSHAPGLTLVHLVEAARGVRHYGPYLGGNRLRDALSGLHRILPLAYTGTGMTGAERDMGRVRGVAASDRGWIADALCALLERHPDATARARAAMAELRDTAAAEDAFERAARIQAEADAIEWITSPQRVTDETVADLDAYGWAGDLLVHYAVRDGRLQQWSQRSSSQADAQHLVGQTPDDWIPFARRNAELAAALALP